MKSSQIAAGQIADVKWNNGTWIFIDIGFANKSKTCGILIHDQKPTTETFAKMVNQLEDVLSADGNFNLVVEAPLSVAFNCNGNPVRRSFEWDSVRKQPRYWYTGSGCSVMVGALYLFRNILDCDLKGRVRLFEGFVSYKDGGKSDHLRDVLLLKSLVKDPKNKRKGIIVDLSEEESEDRKLFSAFKVAGFDFGIPPILVPAQGPRRSK